MQSRFTVLSGILAVILVAFVFSAPAGAVVIEWRSANTEVILDTNSFGLDNEDPPVGTKYFDCTVVENRDTEYLGAGQFKDWTGIGSIDGDGQQAWLRSSNAELTTTTTVPSDAVSFNLEGDSNDGRCNLYVDGNLVATLDMYDPGHNRVIVLVKNLPVTTHTLIVDDIGYSTHGGYGNNIAVFGGTALDQQNTLDVYPAPLVAGQTATFTVTDAKPNTMTFLAYSLYGPGSFPIPNLDITLGLKTPKKLGTGKVTDQSGGTQWSMTIPPAASGLNVWLQSCQPGHTTNVVATTIL